MSAFLAGLICAIYPDDSDTSLGGLVDVISVTASRRYDRTGDGSIRIYADATNADLITRGRRIVASTTSQYFANGSLTIPIANFVITSITRTVAPDGKIIITASGPDLLYELTYRSIGENLIATVTNTTLASTANGDDTTVSVSSAADFAAGQPIFIVLDGGEIHATTITLVVTTTITLSEAIPTDDTATSGNAVTTHSLAPDDIEQIMVFAPSSWSTPSSNTPNGSYLVGAGETVLEALRQARGLGGGHFRLNVSLVINRDVDWLSAPDASPLTAIIMPATATDALMHSGNHGVILRMTKDESESSPQVTRVYSFGASGLKFTAAEDYITVPGGITVDWASSLITHTANESGGAARVERYRSFDNIQPAGDTAADVTNAAINLWNTAYNWLLDRQTQPVFYDIDCVIHNIIKPYSTVTVTYSGDGLDIDESLTIHEVNLRMGEDGTLYHRLRLSDEEILGTRDDSDFITENFQRIDTALRHASNTTSLGTGGILGIGIQHHTLLGLSDDDHSLYLRADGVRALTGNLSVTAGTTIDGVDISAHVIDIDAHHALVTSGNGIVVSGQQVTVDLTGTSGLEFSGGDLQIADTLAGNGLGISSKALTINLASPSGLEISGDNLRLADSIAGAGLGISSKSLFVNPGAGLELSGDDVVLTTPGTLSVGSANVAAGSHTHAITASADPGPAAALLKSSASGGLILQSETIEGSLDITNSGNLTVGTNVLFVNNSGSRIGINMAADSQFALDITGNIRWSGFGVGAMALQVDGLTFLAHYDGGAPYASDFTGTALGHFSQEGVWNGGVIFRPGKFGSKAVQLSEATTNLITNPSFEVDLTDWSNAGSDGGYDTFERVTNVAGKSYFGTAAAHCVPPTSPGGQNYIQDAVPASAATDYTISVWVWVTSGSYTLTTHQTGGASTTTHTVIPDVTGWQRVTQTITTVSGTDNINVRLRHDGTSETSEAWVDGVQVEQKSYPTPYCDGSLDVISPTLVSGQHTWSGTAHASTSSRVASHLQYIATDIIHDPLVGTVMAWVYVDGLTGANQYIFRITSSTTHVILRLDSSGNPSGFWGNASTADSSVIPLQTWTHLAVTGNGDGNFSFYVNGVLIETKSNTTDVVSIPTTAYVGRSTTTVEWLNGKIEDLAIANRQLPADEIRAIYESDAPIFAETSTWSFTIPNQRVWADENGLWMRDDQGAAAFGMAGTDGNSWGGQTLDSGDLMIGNTSNSNFFIDISTGRINIRGGTTVEAYIDTDGSIVAGDVEINSNGIKIYNVSAVFGFDNADTLDFFSSSDNAERTMTIAAYRSTGGDNFGRIAVPQTSDLVDENSLKLETTHSIAGNVAITLSTNHATEERRIELDVAEAFEPTVTVKKYGLGVNIGRSSSINATIEAIQNIDDSVLPVLILDQQDLDQPFIDFQAGTIYTGKTGQDEYIKVETSSGVRYLRLFN